MAEQGPSTSAPAADAPSTSGGDLHANDDELLKAFFSDVKEVDRDNEVNRILWAFKLNPFEQLNLPFNATIDEVKKQYRKLSLLVHPDKCKHTQAAAAFDVLGAAQKKLTDEAQRNALTQALNYARDEIREERQKETKHDNAIKVAAMLHENGREGVEAEWEQTEAFLERWKLKARELLAKMEFRKRKTAKRLKDDNARAEEDLAEKQAAMKKAKEDHVEWESTRDKRVNTWHDFVKGKGGKLTTAGMVKPPKQKTNDEDRLFVQRPVVNQEEEFRQKPKKAGPKKD